MPKAFSQVVALAKGLSKLAGSHSKKKAAPKKRGLAYPYRVVPHDEVFAEENILRQTKFVGKNWHVSQGADGLPIMLMMGFNHWKFGFVSDYVSGYRTAFLPRKMDPISAARLLWSSRELSRDLMIWGYNDASLWLTRLAKRLGYNVYRMEDGFVRSVELGANHSTPYSLVVDNKGLYFNPREPSELEDILNSDPRLHDPEFLGRARKHLDFILETNLTKYNGLRGAAEEFLSIRRREVVLVIGQVPGDASIVYGNPDRWTSESLVALARSENPGCDIIYRPHPDVYNKPHLYKERRGVIAKMATIVPPTVGLLDLLKSVKRVYTISSLVGMEAVMRDIPVTTVGLPFYAGWGVTDDQCSERRGGAAYRRRRAKLSSLQLFAGTYLLYAKYLASPDGDEGLTAACMKIIGERQLRRPPLTIPKGQKDREDLLRKVAKSDDWPMALSHEVLPKLTARDILVVVRNLNLHVILADNSARVYQVAFICRVLGLLSNWDEISEFLRKVRVVVPSEVFSFILNMEWARKSSDKLLQHFSWHLEENEVDEEAYDLLKHSLSLSRAAETGDDGQPKSHRMSDGEASALLTLLQFAFRTRRLNEVIDGCYQLLISSNKYHEEAIQLLVGATNLKFEFSSSVLLAEFDFKAGAPRNKGRNLARIAEDIRFVEPFDREKFLWAAMGSAVASPESLGNTMMLAERLEEQCGVHNFEKIFFSIMSLDNDVTLEKAKAWITLERPEKALPILLELIETKGESLSLLVALSQAYSYQDEFEEAREICIRAIARYEHVNAYREAMRVAVISGDLAWGEELIEAAKERKLDVGEMSLRKIFNGARRIHEALLSQRDVSPHRDVRKNYPEHYTDPEIVEDDFSADDVFFLSVFGPGDEIRAAQIYSDIAKDPHFGRFSIACDPRLQSIMERSFPDLDFVPVARVLRHGVLRDISRYSQLPAYDLRYILDNVGHEHLLKSDRAIMTVDLLAKYRRDYPDFHGEKYLTVNAVRADGFRRRLPQDCVLVGINWRSSVSTFSRNLHYLTIEELAPIFEIEGVQFVNLQYDECSEELAWVEKRFPGKLVNFSDLDQFDDIDGVAALMSELDLVVAPATTVAELSGACGVPTWLLSNTVELDGRKISEGSLVDIWHNSMIHIEGDIRGDKKSLVASLNRALLEFVGNREAVGFEDLAEAG
ncbi:beta-3-deoxy-D-manno-oct-2-ulosonic acid transferase [Sinorhizobium sp. CCBAU 05631]|uniref:capsular polysaccharide export protein, LipB/KpsS family n=1 Tax=Sinorhizobium sp. CCBAU 05631 TaxID=794846 RepID=UPI0004B30E12|nr:beta-3-deoxy-D-manno-oct-2-ulosonic acid transferase [Sinorhizobium sp. CCBAU 05631]ASY56501.1 Capsular polysaccharide export system protein KpsC [Sinorhizobium sp. CCBAU 05631]